MATTTEPPWMNMAQGLAPRNATNSHTINFGFTSTAGSLLWFVIFGAVTHTDASGTWTEREQPVSSGELSIFTKASTGDSSITITHNGSNYSSPWCVIEFPTGSTHLASNGDNASSENFPALTGMSAVDKVIIAARGRTAASVADTAASTVWPGPWVEDVDIFDPYVNGSTEGVHLTVAHQINYAGTSITPSATTTYTGTWSTPDREKVVSALDVAAPAADTTAPSVPGSLATTAIGSTTVDLSWSASSDDTAVTGYEVKIIGP